MEFTGYDPELDKFNSLAVKVLELMSLLIIVSVLSIAFLTATCGFVMSQNGKLQEKVHQLEEQLRITRAK